MLVELFRYNFNATASFIVVPVNPIPLVVQAQRNGGKL
jgi:hypothetical protein